MNKLKPISVLFIYIFGTILFSLILNPIISNSNHIISNLGNILIYILLLIPIALLNKNALITMFKNFKIKYLKDGFIIWIICFIIMILINYILIHNNFNTPSNELLFRNYLTSDLIFSLIIAIILAPILEELTFRLSFNTINNKYLYLVITSLLFGLMHINQTNELIYIIPYGILGLSFGLTYKKTNNIYSSIVIHSIHNLIVILFIGG